MLTQNPATPPVFNNEPIEDPLLLLKVRTNPKEAKNNPTSTPGKKPSFALPSKPNSTTNIPPNAKRSKSQNPEVPTARKAKPTRKPNNTPPHSSEGLELANQPHSRAANRTPKLPGNGQFTKEIGIAFCTLYIHAASPEGENRKKKREERGRGTW
ncbi:hypothetical protein EUGRSUZ_D01850 [Eucalyptus grandis]|uniref:Uncharacterized protein n=2 Tax=Eucalyptus grandis TaxID=71139 RepID=A0ACC3L6V8_EUCGR|nr:hypothetical protein EUGRSUZ_D01850 [Eucalyptus grandis]